MTKSVLVAMSGGVDSSVAAALLLEQGYDVLGATFKLFSGEQSDVNMVSRTCCSLDDISDARRVAQHLGVTHYVFNFGGPFEQAVIRRFAAGYAGGETPNPCIDCNRLIKFPKLLERADMLDIGLIATGHYARVDYHAATGRYRLKRAADHAKDQTYVLYALTQRELARVLFPLGDLMKSDVRLLAEARGLVNARKPDSQDICFVPDGDYAGFLINKLGIRNEPGAFIDRQGTVLGTHRGLIHYTIGQRKGLRFSFSQPKFVIRKDLAANTVMLGDEADLYATSLLAGDVNWIAVDNLTEPLAVQVKIRYAQNAVPAILYPDRDGRVRAVFEQPQRAVTPGQAAVFYQEDLVIGGGTILGELR